MALQPSQDVPLGREEVTPTPARQDEEGHKKILKTISSEREDSQASPLPPSASMRWRIEHSRHGSSVAIAETHGKKKGSAPAGQRVGQPSYTAPLTPRGRHQESVEEIMTQPTRVNTSHQASREMSIKRGRGNFGSSVMFSQKETSTKGSSRPGTQIGVRRGMKMRTSASQVRSSVGAGSARAESACSGRDAKMPHLLNIIQMCSEGEKYKDIAKKVLERKEFIEKKTSELEGAIEDYMDLVKIGDAQHLLKVAEIMHERKKREKDNYVNFLNPVSLRKFRENSEKGTIFLSRLGKRKLWKGDKFVISRKVKIAESFEELISC